MKVFNQLFKKKSVTCEEVARKRISKTIADVRASNAALHVSNDKLLADDTQVILDREFVIKLLHITITELRRNMEKTKFEQQSLVCRKSKLSRNYCGQSKIEVQAQKT